MKKTFFLFAMLASIAASATVTVTPLGVDYAAQKVTFKVAWTGSANNNRVWVWIDLCPAPDVTPGAFQNAVISAASAISGSVLYASTNTRGFFVTTNPSTVTATLSNVSGKFNWCAYGSDYPPNVTAANGTYTFKGTQPFIVTAANGTTSQTVTGTTLPASALTVTPVAMTDRTGYPGVFCSYQKNDLYIDATHLCQQRTSGAQNWEAWIKDTRDNELYRIVLMPDNKWWLAQNVKYAALGFASVGCTADECGRNYSDAEITGGSTAGNVQGICPAGWLLPVNNNWISLLNSIGTIADAVVALRIKTSPCGSATDPYGFANIHGVCYGENSVPNVYDKVSQWYTWDGVAPRLIILDSSINCDTCDKTYLIYNYINRSKKVRCFRQL